MTREEILRAALLLSPAERLSVARQLAESVEAEDEELSEAEWNAAWADEAVRRHREIEEGREKMIPGEQVMAIVRAIVNR